MDDKLTHVLERTSPKGGPFIGRCVTCGREGLTIRAAFQPCENQKGFTQAEAIVAVVKGKNDDGR